MASKLASTPFCANYCPSCGGKFASAGPEENEPHLECSEDFGGCGAKYYIRKL